MNEATCSIDGCDRPVFNKKRAWCRAHYGKWRRNGDPTADTGRPLREERPDRGCSVAGCQQRHEAHGFCPRHLRRWQKDGDPGTSVSRVKKAIGPKPKCAIDGCTREMLVMKRGWCSLHFQRWQRYGDPNAQVKEHRAPGDPIPSCAVESCDRDSASRGYCIRHYRNLMSYGDPLSDADRTPMQRLERTGWDVTDAGCWEWRGSRSCHGYGRIMIDRTSWLAPRLMLSLTDPRENISELVVRHACDNPPCVNPDHLTWGSMRENTADMLERHREASYLTDWWGGVCRNGLHDITKPGALTRVKSKKSPRGYSLRCVECRKANRTREHAARRARNRQAREQN